VSAMCGRYDTFAPERGQVLTLFRPAAHCPRNPIPRARKPVHADARGLGRCAPFGAYSRQVHAEILATHGRGRRRPLCWRSFAAPAVRTLCHRASLPVRAFMTACGRSRLAQFASLPNPKCRCGLGRERPPAQMVARPSRILRASNGSRCDARAATAARSSVPGAAILQRRFELLSNNDGEPNPKSPVARGMRRRHRCAALPKTPASSPSQAFWGCVWIIRPVGAFVRSSLTPG
jgi:hypothetical protein